MGRTTNSKEVILDAAEAVVSNSGAAHMTLDAVAERAGVSKGGLLYNFPSKEKLLMAMLTRQLARADEDRKSFLESNVDDAKPISKLKAYIRAGFEERGKDQKICAALLAAGANNPKLLVPVREWHRKNLRQLSAGCGNPMRVMALMLAIDGLWLNDLLDTLPVPARQRGKLLKELLNLADAAA